MASIDWAKTTARRNEKHLSLGIWCVLYLRFDGIDKYNAFAWNNIAEVRTDNIFSKHPMACVLYETGKRYRALGN